MKWTFPLILVGLLAAGCKSQAPVCDPFFGRTTIPPPPTGSITGRPADPSYQPPPLAPPQSPAGVCPPAVQLPSQPTSQSPSLSGPAPVSQPTPSAGTYSQPAAPPASRPNYAAPRPSSTAPANTFTPRPSSPMPSPGPYVPPTGASPYTPPGGSFDYRGTSTQGSSPSMPAQADSRAPSASFANVATTRIGAASDDRMPRPVDDAGAAAGIPSDRRPIAPGIQPRGQADASDRPVDIMDLPKTSTGGP